MGTAAGRSSKVSLRKQNKKRYYLRWLFDINS
jgi:hypothetical protein